MFLLIDLFLDFLPHLRVSCFHLGLIDRRHELWRAGAPLQEFGSEVLHGRDFSSPVMFDFAERLLTPRIVGVVGEFPLVPARCLVRTDLCQALSSGHRALLDYATS